MTDDRRPLVIVTGALAPYTDLLYDRLASEIDRPLHVIACCVRERDRLWEIAPRPRYRFEVCPGVQWYRNTQSTVYLNPRMPFRIARLKPRVLILNDFSPTMLMAAWAARATGTPYGVRTDGRIDLDPGQTSRAHRVLRRQIVRGASFGLGPTERSLDLLRFYGLERNQTYLAPLFPAWTAAPYNGVQEEQKFDLLFCGSLNEEIKGALFFAEVALRCAALRGRLKVRVVGDGPLRSTLRERFAAADVDAHFDGFLPQHRLAEAYRSAKLFLFPSRGDVWGVVVQEALQSGACVLASPHSGAALDLIDAYSCGRVAPLETDLWVDKVIDLLAKPDLRATFNENAGHALADFSIDAAVSAYRRALTPYPS